MKRTRRNEQYVSEVQHAYAGVLQGFVIVGFVTLFVTFVLFASGLLPNRVPLESVPQYWDEPADAYVAATGFPTGWAWLGSLQFGDVLTFGALILLASGTIICFLVAVVLYGKRRDYAYAAMVLAEVIVLVIAASGVVAAH